MSVSCVAAVLLTAATLRAQSIDAVSATAADAAPATKAALSGGMILLGAAGAQYLHTPKAWERDWQGFGYRVADRTGFHVAQAMSFRSLASLLDYRQDAVLCPRDRLVGCAFTATFTAFDRVGRRRFNAPLVTSLLVGTGASLLWRPERSDNGESWAFVGTRLGIAFGGYVAERVVVDWWAQRAR